MQTMTSLTRRGLLKSGGALLVGFALGPALPKRSFAQNAAAAPGVDSFLAIHA